MAKKQPIKKKSGDLSPSDKLSFLEEFKKNNGLSVDTDNLDNTTADKDLDWIILPEAYQDAVKLPGIPQGYSTMIMGWSNTGKSTLKYVTIAAAQQQGILPVIYETENHFNWKHAIECGVQAEPEYGEPYEFVDEETGEITMKRDIINYKGFFIFMDSTILNNMYGDIDHSKGTKIKGKRGVAVIEDIAYSMNDLMDKQNNGELQFPMLFIWDSVGSIGSYKSFTSKTGNNMFDAGAIANSFNLIVNNRIPSSHKKNCEFTNTFVFINKIWNDSMNSMGGIPSIEAKGGKTLYYGARMSIYLGGKTKSAVKKQKATYKGNDYECITTTKIKIEKNHLPTPYNTTFIGEMGLVHNGLIPANTESYKKYKDEYLPYILGLEEGSNIDVTEVLFTEDATESED